MREIGENFADHRRELEAVAGAGRRDHDRGGAGQPVDDEIAVRRDGVEAGPGVDAAVPFARRQMVGDRGADQRLVLGRNSSVIAVRVDRFVAMVMLCDLDAAPPNGGKP